MMALAFTLGYFTGAMFMGVVVVLAIKAGANA